MGRKRNIRTEEEELEFKKCNLRNKDQRNYGRKNFHLTANTVTSVLHDHCYTSNINNDRSLITCNNHSQKGCEDFMKID